MSCRILYSPTDNKACLYCSTTDTVFGPLFGGDGFDDAEQEAEAFCGWIEARAKGQTQTTRELVRMSDPRWYSADALAAMHAEFRGEREAVKA